MSQKITYKEAKARVLSQVLEIANGNQWRDTDDFLLRFADKLMLEVQTKPFSPEHVNQASTLRTTFFTLNKIGRKKFTAEISKSLSHFLRDFPQQIQSGPITFSELFPEINQIALAEAKKLTPFLNINERLIQNAFRDALREKNATNMVERNSDSSLETADVEHFILDINGVPKSFTSVVKGFKSVSGSRITFENISHQIIKAFNGTNPDYILLVLAKPPVDDVITQITRYSESVGNRYLIILVDPVNLAKFLRNRKVI